MTMTTSELAAKYGATAQDWLNRFDSGKPTWSISMGGMGEGYEQPIHSIAAEFLREMIRTNFDVANGNEETWGKLEKIVDPIIYAHPQVSGCTGAQYGAGRSLAAHMMRKGPLGIFNDPVVAERHIQVTKM